MDKHPQYLKKQEYLSKLGNEEISLVYNDKVHAKLVTVVDAVAIVSSVNFYPESSAGASWEAGLITTKKEAVNSIINLISSRLS